MGVIVLIVGALCVIGLMIKLGCWTEKFDDMCENQNLTDVNKNVYRDKNGRYKSNL